MHPFTGGAFLVAGLVARELKLFFGTTSFPALAVDDAMRAAASGGMRLLLPKLLAIAIPFVDRDWVTNCDRRKSWKKAGRAIEGGSRKNFSAPVLAGAPRSPRNENKPTRLGVGCEC